MSREQLIEAKRQMIRRDGAAGKAMMKIGIFLAVIFFGILLVAFLALGPMTGLASIAVYILVTIGGTGLMMVIYGWLLNRSARA